MRVISADAKLCSTSCVKDSAPSDFLPIELKIGFLTAIEVSLSVSLLFLTMVKPGLSAGVAG